MQQSNWHAAWIGDEPRELHQLRSSGAVWISNAAAVATEDHDTQHAYRYRFMLSKAVRHADLYATGEDTAAAWVNGEAVLAAKPLPPWQRTPWGTYERVEVTGAVRQGEERFSDWRDEVQGGAGIACGYSDTDERGAFC